MDAKRLRIANVPPGRAYELAREHGTSWYNHRPYSLPRGLFPGCRLVDVEWGPGATLRLKLWREDFEPVGECEVIPAIEEGE